MVQLHLSMTEQGNKVNHDITISWLMMAQYSPINIKQDKKIINKNQV